MQGYCGKCKTMRDIANAQTTKTADGKVLVKGTCAVCGTVVMRLGAAEGTTDDGRRTTESAAWMAGVELPKQENKPPTPPSELKPSQNTTPKPSDVASTRATAPQVVKRESPVDSPVASDE